MEQLPVFHVQFRVFSVQVAIVQFAVWIAMSGYIMSLSPSPSFPISHFVSCVRSIWLSSSFASPISHFEFRPASVQLCLLALLHCASFFCHIFSANVCDLFPIRTAIVCSVRTFSKFIISKPNSRMQLHSQRHIPLVQGNRYKL